RIAELQGLLELKIASTTDWIFTQTNQILKPGYLLRTGRNSRVALRWSDQSVMSFGAETMVEILPPEDRESQAGLHLFKGILSFFHRDKPDRIRVVVSGTRAGVKGTEFAMQVETVNDKEETTIYVIDGQVELTNAHGRLVLTNGQPATVEIGQ